MSAAVPSCDLPELAPAEAKRTRSALRSDRLIDGVLLLLLFSVGQRMIGFVRGVLFCRWLEPNQLGMWELAFSFLMLAGPLVVLGIPGSFGRYAERFRQRGQLAPFLGRTSYTTLGLALFASVLLAAGCRPVAYLLFNNPAQYFVVILLAPTLLFVVGFNFVVEMSMALRQVRVVTLLQFGASLLFAVFGPLLLAGWTTSVEAVVVAYGLACLIPALPAVLWLRSIAREHASAHSASQATAADTTTRSFWAQLIPFAAWIWATNLLTNLFETTDRYMIVHFGGFDPDHAASLVGNYHASRMLPLLMIAVTGMVANMLVPYLSHDWERGKQRLVALTMNLSFKLVGIVTLSGAAVILLAAPLFFDWVLDGKYGHGLAALPWTLVFCIWFSMAMIAQNYLFCAEKPRLVSAVCLLGLTANIGLNLLLLPWYGLTGAVMATAIANGLGLCLIMLLAGRQGMRWDGGALLIAVLPLVVPLGPIAAGATTLSLLGVAATRGFFSRQQKKVLRTEFDRYWSKVRGIIRGN